MPHILGIGIATVDIVNEVDGYPAEDDEVRALAQTVTRGGNATNTLVVLSQLGDRCAWAGVLADDAGSALIRADLARHGVDCASCRVVPAGATPTSYITLNRRNGSRTIVHHRDLPEFGYDDFARIDLGGSDWLHFEGRAVDETRRMLARARQRWPALPRSVEIEKPRPGIEALYADADILIFSRAYASHLGQTQPQAFLRAMRERAPHAELVCTWGADGAHALTPDGRLLHSPAFPPSQVVDTLGAGDSFNAGYIHARLRSGDIRHGLEQACRLAGRKCGQRGFDGLGRAPGEAP